jgi:hypothetical protein
LAFLPLLIVPVAPLQILAAEVDRVRLEPADLNVPYVMTAAFARTDAHVTYLRARVVQFVASTDGKTIDLVDANQAGLGRLFKLPIVSRDVGTGAYDVILGGAIDRWYLQSPIYNRLEATNPEAYMVKAHRFDLKVEDVPPEWPRKVTQAGKTLRVDITLPVSVAEGELGEPSGCRPIDTSFCAVQRPVRIVTEQIAAVLHLRLAPKKERAGFVPKLDPGTGVVGLYTSFPDRDGRTYVAKQYLRDPIVYEVRGPEPFPEVVEEAASYWNRILARQAIALRHLDASIDIWDPYVNSIILYPGEAAGGGRGIFPVLDDGQIVASHIYLGAGFIGYAAQQFEYYAPELSKLGWTEPQIKDARRRYIHDYLVQTVAHEMGHALGLMHNFKGSTAGRIPDLEQTMWRYLTKDRLEPGEWPSSSLMEYMNIDYFVLMGAQIRQSYRGGKNFPPLQYDEYAVQWAYNSDTLAPDPQRAGPYCYLSEAQIVSPRDPSCRQFDDPPGMRLMRVSLGSQRAVFFRQTAEFSQSFCQRAFDWEKAGVEAPPELNASWEGGAVELRSTDGAPFASRQAVCNAVQAMMRLRLDSFAADRRTREPTD